MSPKQIKVKPGLNEYTLKGDDGTFIGELVIHYDRTAKTCLMEISKRGATMTSLSIERRI